MVKIEKTYFTGYCLYPTENGRISDIKAYFASYCLYLSAYIGINACNNYLYCQ